MPKVKAELRLRASTRDVTTNDSLGLYFQLIGYTDLLMKINGPVSCLSIKSATPVRVIFPFMILIPARIPYLETDQLAPTSGAFP